MAEYFKNLIRTKKKFIFLIFFYSISIIFTFQIIRNLIYPNILPVLENTILLPSDDGLVWKNSDKGIILKEIHNPYVNQLEIGDILIKIDQQPIFLSESLEEILKSLPPGSVLMYQIKRPSANNELIQVLVRTYPKVIFKPESAIFQWIYQILNLACLFAGIFLLLLVYPFISRGNDALKWYGFSIFSIVFSLLYLLLDFQPTIYQEKTEIYFNYLGWIFSVLLLIFASFLLRWKLFYWDLPIDICLGCFFLYFMIYKKNIITYQNEIPIFASVILFKSLGLNFHFSRWKIQWITWAMMGLSILSVIFFPNVYTFIFLWVGILFFKIYGIYRYLKISKVNLVAQQFILIIVLVTVFSLSYFLSGLISKQFPYDFQNIIKIILSLIVSFVVVYILFLNKNWWKKWLFFSYENKVEKLQKFQISMINYLHKEPLLNDFKKEIIDFLGDVKLDILLEIDEKNPYFSILPYFHQNTFWSKSKELIKNPMNIPEELVKNVDSDIELIFPLIFSNQKKGLILIGKKKDGGYYNLEEAEILQRTIIQLSLIINLLTLLEKEKLLVQKTLEANLTALRSQINPHFLFNALNTISSLIHDSPDLAEEAVEHLAFIFRYTLKTSNEQFAALKDEMQLIKHYLAIEKIRFGKRLSIDIQIDDNCLEILIPSLVIQTLVENCIKHGISKLTKDGIIKIQFYKENEFLIGIIYDNGPGIKTENIHKGTGLNNVLTRLEQIYGKNHEIRLENTGQGTEVTLKIPIEKKR